MVARAAACATVPGADIRPQLATLLGKREVDIGPIRRTSETPPRGCSDHLTHKTESTKLYFRIPPRVDETTFEPWVA